MIIDFEFKNLKYVALRETSVGQEGPEAPAELQ